MNWKTLLLIAALFAGALVAGRFLGGKSSDSQYTQLPPVQCVPQAGPCIYVIEGKGELTLSIEPKENIQPMQPLTATVSYSGDSMLAEAVTLTGLNMEMGFNRFRFVGSSGDYSANIIIPVCTLSRMEWEALVEAEIDGDRLALPIHFSVERN